MPRKNFDSSVFQRALSVMVLAALLAGCRATPPTATPPVPASIPTLAPQPTASRTSPRNPTPAETATGDPYALISAASLMAFTEDLTSIQAYSGWRNSASLGEAEAIEYVTETLNGYSFLMGMGLEIERQPFRVYTGTEFWEERVILTISGQEFEVPAEAMRGSRDSLEAALRFDSDGQPNDSDRNPVQVSGPVVLVFSQAELDALQPETAAGKVLFVRQALVDHVIQDRSIAARNAGTLLALQPAAVVVVTQFSNQPGEAHGTFIADSSVFSAVDPSLPKMPVLFFRLEDLSAAGVNSWEQLSGVQSAELVWDADVFSPADSANLIARIPGIDSSRAVLLGAHIDSPNTPGALDDGSGSVILLEVARTLEQARVQPPVDVYLLWFGSEELGLWGSGYFAAAHSELLDRTVGMLQTDMLSYPLEGIQPYLSLNSWPYDRLDPSSGGRPWSEHLRLQASARGIHLETAPYYGKLSDNSSFDGFGVPNAQMEYANDAQMSAAGGVWYAGHIHSPYDTAELVRAGIEPLQQMVAIALSAALDVPPVEQDLRPPPEPEHRAVIVASHAETPHLTPAEMNVFGMQLSLEGFDVDVVPYGQPVKEADIEGAELVIALPVFDLSNPALGTDLYDEAWTPAEVETLVSYVEAGGLLVITGAARRVKHGLSTWEGNEDQLDANALSQPLGVNFLERRVGGSMLQPQVDHPLLSRVGTLRTAVDNTVALQADRGQVLATAADGSPAIALVPAGSGEALVLGDVSLFSTDFSGPGNLPLWRNLAEYARAR